MANEIKAPTFPESVQDGVVATWHKKAGDTVSRDELLVEIETDKVVLEVVASADGVLGAILKNEGDTVLSNEVLASISEGGAEAPAAAAAVAPESIPQSPSNESVTSYTVELEDTNSDADLGKDMSVNEVEDLNQVEKVENAL